MGTHILCSMKTSTLVAVAVFAAACAHKQKTDEPATAAAPSSARADARPTTPLKHDAPTAGGGEDDCAPVQVHFGLDSSQLETDEARLLEKPARCLTGDRARQAVLAGHADERGTEEYNLALGDRRAHTVEQHLERLGVPPRQLETVSRGELDPLCQDHDEACWSKNRRTSVKPK